MGIVDDDQQNKAPLHSEWISSNRTQIATLDISFYKVIHEYKVRGGTTLSTEKRKTH